MPKAILHLQCQCELVVNDAAWTVALPQPTRELPQPYYEQWLGMLEANMDVVVSRRSDVLVSPDDEVHMDMDMDMERDLNPR